MAEIWQSDLRVKMTQKKTRTQSHYLITIKTDNDDMSRSPHLIFSLPRNAVVKKIKFSRGFERTAYQVYGNKAQAETGTSHRIDGYVKVDFNNMNRQTVKVKITIAEVGEGYQRGDGASAFVFSLTPELNKKNNFAYLPLN